MSQVDELRKRRNVYKKEIQAKRSQLQEYEVLYNELFLADRNEENSEKLRQCMNTIGKINVELETLDSKITGINNAITIKEHLEIMA